MNKVDLESLYVKLVQNGAGNGHMGDLIASLKDSGRSIVESIYLVSKIYDVGLAEAKEAVVMSVAWRARVDSHEKFHDDLIEHIEG